MTEKGRPVELSHERLGELLEGVGQDDHLGEGAEFVEEFLRAGQGGERADDLLDVGQFQIVLVQ